MNYVRSDKYHFVLRRLQLWVVAITLFTFRNANAELILTFGKKSFSFTIPTVDVKNALTEFLDLTSVTPVYLVEYGRDCDGASGTNYLRFANRRQARTYMAETKRWADGPIVWYRISRKQYNEAIKTPEIPLLTDNVW